MTPGNTDLNSVERMMTACRPRHDSRLDPADTVPLAMALLTLIGSDAEAQDRRYTIPQPTPEELPEVAGTLIRGSPRIAEIWPGFWSPDQGFLLLSPRGGMVLVASFAPPPEFIPAPEGSMPAVPPRRSFVRDGLLPGSRLGTFPGVVEISGHPVYALPPMGSSLARRVSFYTHEAFHYYQRQGGGAWVETPEDTIMGLSPAAALRAPDIVNDSLFRAGLRHEDLLLHRMLVEEYPTKLRALLADYLDARAERLREHPDVLGIERRYERREGTAEYVGCRAAAVALADSSWLRTCITANLNEDRPDDPLLQFLRWRLYSTGAVLALILDRLVIPGWKAELALGEHLDVLARRAASPTPPSSQSIHRSGRSRAIGERPVEPLPPRGHFR